MKFLETGLEGAFIIDPDLIGDERGFFARSFCRREFESRGLSPNVAQCNISFNRRRGTLRGMHYQVAPHEEARLVRCTRGSVYDVIVDLRPNSPTLLRWINVELSSENHRMLYIPGGFAHGFQSLHDKSEVFYQMSESYVPQSQRGLRWDDPALNIAWPIADPIVSARDLGHPYLSRSSDVSSLLDFAAKR
jgi:dTDP-4-dehydrorhamnose 3,5-epimerase